MSAAATAAELAGGDLQNLDARSAQVGVDRVESQVA